MRLVLFTLFLLCSVVNSDKDYCSSQQSPSKNSSDMKSNYEHIKFYTTRPGHSSLSETMAVSYDGGLYVAGEKVITESEHRRVVSELRDELYSTQTSLQETQAEVVALVQALREVSPANGSSIVQPPTCEKPGGDKLHFNGTHWECVCKHGFDGNSCELQSGPLVILLVGYTSTTGGANTLDTVLAQFNVSGSWTDPQVFFSGATLGSVQQNRFTVWSFPTHVKILIDGGNSWGYWKLVLDDIIIMEDPNGSSGTAYPGDIHGIGGFIDGDQEAPNDFAYKVPL